MKPTADTEQVRSICPYCGVGCGLSAYVRDGRLERVSGDLHYPVNRGRLCAKPLALPEASRSPDRAYVPLRRDSLGERWRESTWEEVLPSLAERLKAVIAEHGPDAVAFYISGQLLTEDYYAINKLVKGFLGTNNVDSNSRLCMSSAVSGYTGNFGADGPPPSFADLDLAGCFLLLGTNTAHCHPIAWSRIRDRQAQGAKMIVVDPRRTDTAMAADVHLALAPGTDLALLNSMLWVIEREALVDRDYVERHTEGYAAALDVAAQWPPDRAAEVCGVDPEAIAKAARLFARADGAMALWAMGANQSTVGSLKNQALNNLCLLTGQIGRPGTGPLSLTGQPNAMGGREVGGLAALLPGYRSVLDAAHREEMRHLWNLPRTSAGISPRPGLTATELTEALEDGRVRALWICATNPAVSMPDAARFRSALRRAELVVCQDAYHPTESSALAHVMLPAAQWPEKEGTMTNSERRVGLVRRAINPPGAARADWEIFAGLGRALGYPDAFGWASSEEVFAEFVMCTGGRPCDYSGLSHARLRRDGGVQWPCRASDPALGEHPGTTRLYVDGQFPTFGGRARILPTPHADLAERPDTGFPIVLTTGRVAHQWHTMTRTGKSPTLLGHKSDPFVELNEEDAAAAGIVDGAPVRVVSRRGSVVLRARVMTQRLAPGLAFAPFHWGALHAPPGAGTLNDVTISAIDPVSRQPELKACAVRLEPVQPGNSQCKQETDRARRDTHIHPGGGARARGRGHRPRLLVVGAGMAAQSTVEAVFDNGCSEDWAVTMVGSEPTPPYNRIMLSRLLASDCDERALALRPESWFQRRGIDLRTGTTISAVHPQQRMALTDAGERIPYDALVLATGSHPAIPPIQGLDRSGVHTFRTLHDVRAIAADALRVHRAVVMGGGLLGLEAARGLVELGLRVSVVDVADRLMPTQLDSAAASLLERQMSSLGVTTLLGRATTAVLGDEHVESVRFADGEELACDLVVVAVGIRPNVELAHAMGLELGRGVLVDDELRTSAPGVWAVGECVEHRGTVYGLWAPLLEQARVAGASICGEPAGFQGAMPATMLKVMGVDLFCAGRHSAGHEGDHEILTLNTRHGIYRKLVLADGRLDGAILFGDLSLSERVRELARSGGPVPEGLLAPVLASAISAHDDDEDLVCTCNVVTRSTIRGIVRAQDLDRVEDVAEATGASSGCGTCAPAIEALLAEVNAERRGEHHPRVARDKS